MIFKIYISNLHYLHIPPGQSWHGGDKINSKDLYFKFVWKGCELMKYSTNVNLNQNSNWGMIDKNNIIGSISELFKSLLEELSPLLVDYPALIYRLSSNVDDDLINQKIKQISHSLKNMNMDSLVRMNKLIKLYKDQWILMNNNINDQESLESLVFWVEEFPYRISRAAENIEKTQYDDSGQYALGFLDLLPIKGARETAEPDLVQPFLCCIYKVRDWHDTTIFRFHKISWN